MRTPLLLAALLVASPALARSAGETCQSAGWHTGTAAFTRCVMRMQGDDDPLAALEDAKVKDETVPDTAPAVPAIGEGPVAAAVKPPPSHERKPLPLQGNIVINGEVISSAPPPAAPPPAAPPPAAPPAPARAPSGFPPIAQPAMPVITVPNWSWNGTGLQ
jgi:hypothetical protein